MRAQAGQTKAAIAIFAQCRKQGDPMGWNEYVDASIAFLERDRAALQKARDALARVPRPKEMQAGEFKMVDVNGKPIDIPWPLNLDVVDRLLECFEHSYAQAYKRGCKDMKKTP